MKWIIYFLLCLFIMLSAAFTSFANIDTISINAITINGNKKTKEKTILRQLAFKIGEEIAIADTAKIIELSTNQLLNTSLFIKAKISLKKSPFNHQNFEVTINVAERWYFFPSPYFKIADRNFNTWWRQYNFNLKRVDFGAQLKHFNLTGNNDVLNFVAYGGFSGNVQLKYRLPQLGRKQIYGFETEVKYKRRRTTHVSSINNKQVFYPANVPNIFEEPTQQEFKINATLTRQKKVNITQHFGIRYQNNKISSQIQQLENTPDFFPKNNLQFQYLSLFANIKFDFRNLSAYPTKGWYHKTEFIQTGLGILNKAQQTRLILNTTYYHSFNKRISTLNNLKVLLSHQNQPNYFLTEAMGYGSNDVRGYEDFIIDGQHYLLQRNALRYQLFNFTVKPPILHKIEQIQNVPVTILPKVYFEYGKVWDRYFAEQNPLANKWLFGYGIGIDVVTFYDVVASFEFSFSRQNTGRLVLQFDHNY